MFTNARTIKSKLGKTALAGALVAALVAPTFILPANAAPMALNGLHDTVRPDRNTHNVEWHGHGRGDGGAVAGAILGLGILGLGAAALSQRNDNEYYYEGAYPQPYYAPPVYAQPYYAPPVYAPRYYNGPRAYYHNRGDEGGCRQPGGVCYGRHGNAYHVGPLGGTNYNAP